LFVDCCSRSVVDLLLFILLIVPLFAFAPFNNVWLLLLLLLVVALLLPHSLSILRCCLISALRCWCLFGRSFVVVHVVVVFVTVERLPVLFIPVRLDSLICYVYVV
jgi:hypothetical protein